MPDPTLGPAPRAGGVEGQSPRRRRPPPHPHNHNATNRPPKSLTQTVSNANNPPMHPSPRICRALVEDHLGPPDFTERQIRREEKILAAAEHLMVKFGRAAVSMRLLATALRMSTSTLIWHYTDMDALLAEILRRHLRAITQAVGAVPHNAPNRQTAMRQAYLAATRAAFGRLTSKHLLLTRDRHLLPADELDHIEQTIQTLGETIAGDLGPEAMDVLNLPWATPEIAEPILATINTARHPAKPPTPQPLTLTSLRPAAHTHTDDTPWPPPRTGPPDPMANFTDAELLAQA